MGAAAAIDLTYAMTLLTWTGIYRTRIEAVNRLAAMVQAPARSQSEEAGRRSTGD